VGLFYNYVHTKFHKHHYNSVLVIATKPKVKYRFCVAIVL